MDSAIAAHAPDNGVTDAEDRRRLLDLLLARRSTSALEDPAPAGRDLELILDLGLRAPDHGRLRPWRFVLIRGDARTAFADRLVAAARRRDPAAPQALLDRYRAWPLRTPLLIGVGAMVRANHVIPEAEQILSAGAAAMNMLNAIHLLGYAGMWVTAPTPTIPRSTPSSASKRRAGWSVSSPSARRERCLPESGPRGRIMSPNGTVPLTRRDDGSTDFPVELRACRRRSMICTKIMDLRGRVR